MYFKFNAFKNELVTIIRFGAPSTTDGIVTSAPSKLKFRASITPAGSRTAPPDKFGRGGSQSILYVSRLQNALRIEEEGQRADVIYWRERFWRVVSLVRHTFILPHAESEAVIMNPNESQELRDLV